MTALRNNPKRCSVRAVNVKPQTVLMAISSTGSTAVLEVVPTVATAKKGFKFLAVSERIAGARALRGSS
jgi:hypothetical protein